MIDELIPYFIGPVLFGGMLRILYEIDKFKTHLNFLGAFIIAILGIGALFGIVALLINFIDALCPKCYRYSPKFVWSYGYTGSHKHLCERCDSNRIKEVYGDNLKYLEQLSESRD
jgi:hypothetical protein